MQFLSLQLMEMQQNLLKLENLRICLKCLNLILVHGDILNMFIQTHKFELGFISLVSHSFANLWVGFGITTSHLLGRSE